jgi:hypothetical protein
MREVANENHAMQILCGQLSSLGIVGESKVVIIAALMPDFIAAA